VVLGFGLGSRVLGKGSPPFTRALYPPGGERLGKNPTIRSLRAQQINNFIARIRIERALGLIIQYALPFSDHR
jgi:hypothetical protein